MAKAGFYAVARGRNPGVYPTWGECEDQVKGFQNARYKKFNTMRQAEEFVAEMNLQKPPASSAPGIASQNPAPEASSRSNTTAIAGPSTGPNNGAKTFQSDDAEVIRDGWDVVYCDGACKGNQHGKDTAVAGVGVWWADGDPRNVAERCPGDQTNNRAELIALVRVLEDLSPTVTKLLIKSDSQYSIRCVETWHHSWAANGWVKKDRSPVLNMWLIRYLLALLDLRTLQGVKVKFEYVKGHAGIKGNEEADYMANIGATMDRSPERDWEGLCKEKLEEVECLRSGSKTRKYEVVEVVDKGVQVPTPPSLSHPVATATAKDPLLGKCDDEDDFWDVEGFPDDDELTAAMDKIEEAALRQQVLSLT